jgi:poly(A) polymerase
MSPLYTTAMKIVARLQEAGYIAYFAGGWVRDFLMGHPSDDIDIATNASVAEVQKLFTKTIPVGVAFGIVIVVLEGMQFEVATFRRDHGYIDGRRPTGIDPTDPQEDAQRRDFTINGLFYDPLCDKVYDFVGGAADIEKGIIRAIGNPDLRFAEDRLRMMRAVRYATRFGFPIDPATERAIQAHASELMRAVAIERIWQEFKKIAQFGHFDRGLFHLHRLGLLPEIFPELKEITLVEIEKRLSHIPDFPKDAPPLALLLELFPSFSLQEIVTLIERLKLSKVESAFAQFYEKAKSLFSMPKSWRDALENLEWAQFYAAPLSSMCLSLVEAHLKGEEKVAFMQENARRKERLAGAISRLETKTPYLRASDLLQEGIAPGETMGKLLDEALRMAVNEGVEEKEQILKRLRASPLWPN